MQLNYQGPSLPSCGNSEAEGITEESRVEGWVGVGGCNLALDAASFKLLGLQLIRANMMYAIFAFSIF